MAVFIFFLEAPKHKGATQNIAHSAQFYNEHMFLSVGAACRTFIMTAIMTFSMIIFLIGAGPVKRKIYAVCIKLVCGFHICKEYQIYKAFQNFRKPPQSTKCNRGGALKPAITF
jgi:hypothetical protein